MTSYINEVFDDGMDEPSYILTTNTVKFGVPRNRYFMDFGKNFPDGKNTNQYHVFGWICRQIKRCVENPDNQLEYLDFSSYKIFKTFRKTKTKNQFIKMIEILSKSPKFKIIVIRPYENKVVKDLIINAFSGTGIEIVYEYHTDFMANNW